MSTSTNDKGEVPELTRDEFYEKYGAVEVIFSSYYKYTFTHVGIAPDGSIVSVGYGGSADQIYRHTVEAGKVETVLELRPYTGEIIKGGVVVETMYDY